MRAEKVCVAASLLAGVLSLPSILPSSLEVTNKGRFVSGYRGVSECNILVWAWDGSPFSTRTMIS